MDKYFFCSFPSAFKADIYTEINTCSLNIQNLVQEKYGVSLIFKKESLDSYN